MYKYSRRRREGYYGNYWITGLREKIKLTWFALLWKLVKCSESSHDIKLWDLTEIIRNLKTNDTTKSRPPYCSPRQGLSHLVFFFPVKSVNRHKLDPRFPHFGWDISAQKWAHAGFSWGGLVVLYFCMWLLSKRLTHSRCQVSTCGLDNVFVY